MGRTSLGSFLIAIAALVIGCASEGTLTHDVATRPSSVVRAPSDPCSEVAVASAIASIPPSPEPPIAAAPELKPLGLLIAEPAPQRVGLPAELSPHAMVPGGVAIVGISRKPDFMPFEISRVAPQWETLDALLPADVRPAADAERRARQEMREVGQRPELEGCRTAVNERRRSRAAALQKALEPHATSSDAAALRLATLELAAEPVDLDAPADQGPPSLARLGRVISNHSAQEELGRAARYELGLVSIGKEGIEALRELVEASSTPAPLRADALYRWASLEEGAHSLALFERLDALLATEGVTAEPPFRAVAAMGWFWAATRQGDPKPVAAALARLTEQRLVWADPTFAAELGTRLGLFLGRATNWNDLRGATLPSSALAAAAVIVAQDAMERGLPSLAQRAVSVVEEHGKSVPSLVESGKRLRDEVKAADPARATPRARAIRLAEACLESSLVAVPFTIEWSPRSAQASATFAVRGLEKRGAPAAELEGCLKERAPHALWDAPAFKMQIAPAKR